MAVRRATRQYDDILSFLNDYDSTIQSGGVFLPAATLKGELANEIRLDFVLPMVGRAGPVKAQVVHRSPAGVALRIPAMSSEVQDLFDRFFAETEKLRAHFIATSDVVPRTEHEAALQSLREEMAAAVEQAKAEAQQAAQVAAQAQARAQALAQVAASAADGEAPPQVVVVPAGAPAPEPEGPRPHGFPVPDLSEMAPVISGSMQDRSFRDLLLQLAIERMRGVLEVRHSDGRVRYGFWDRGGPVGWRTDPVQEGEVLGVLLYRSEQITREQLQESLRFMEERDCRQGEAFIEMGVMSFPQLVMVLGKQVDYILQQILQARDGEWSFYVLDELPERFLPPPLRVPSLLFRGLFTHARTISLTELRQTQADKFNRYVSLSEDAKAVLSDIKLAPAEKKFLEVMQSNSWRFRELFTVSPLSRAQTTAFLWAMDEMGFVEYASNEDIARKIARLTKRVRAKKKHIARGNKFDILEIHWICLPKEIDAAYAKLKDDFDLSGAGIPVSAKLAKEAEVILQHIEDAYQTIKPDKSRREYRKTLIEPMMLQQSAELLSRKGEMAIMRRDRREACGCFAKALELIPSHPEFRDGLKRSTAIV